MMIVTAGRVAFIAVNLNHVKIRHLV